MMALLTCQDILNSFCNVPANCLSHAGGRFSGPLFAAHSGPGAAQWRCYAASALDPTHSTYVQGDSYCTRDSELRAIDEAPPCNGTTPTPAPTPRAPSLPQVGIFHPDELAQCYRIPAAIMLPKTGTILAFAEARQGSCSDGATQNLAVSRSVDGGATWSNATSAVGSKDYLVGNPTAVALADGRAMLLFVKHAPGCTGGCGTGNGFVTSSDDGRTWRAPVDVSSEWGPASGSLPGPGTALQLASGRILVVSHHNAYERDYISLSDGASSRCAALQPPLACAPLPLARPR